MKWVLFVISILIITLLLSLVVQAKIIRLNGYVNRVIDGDTLVISTCTGLLVKIRLSGVDAYEAEKNRHLKKQIKRTGLDENTILKLGKKAKRFVDSLLTHKVVCAVFDTNHLFGAYGRYLGIVYPIPCSLVDNKTKSINDILLEKHLAIEYKK